MTAAPTWSTETKKDGIRRVRGVSTHWRHPPHPASTALQQGAPRNLQFLQWEKREPRVNTELTHHYGLLPRRPTRFSNYRSFRENLWSLTTARQIVIKKGHRGYSKHHSGLGSLRPSSKLYQSRERTSAASTAEPRRWPEPRLLGANQATGSRWAVCLIQDPNNSTRQPWSQFSHCAWTGKLINHPIYCWIQPPVTFNQEAHSPSYSSLQWHLCRKPSQQVCLSEELSQFT